MGERNLPARILDCALYPVRGEGAFVIVAGAFAFPALWSCWRASGAWMRSGYTFVLGLAGVAFCTAGLVSAGAYLLVYVQEVLKTGARGENAPPHWPRMNAAALLEVFFFLLVCLPIILPGAAVVLAHEENRVLLGLLPYWMAVYCWFPIAFLVFTRSKQVLKAMNPVVVFGVARRRVLEYGRVLLVLGAVSAALGLVLWAAWAVFLIVLLPVWPFSGVLYHGLRDGAMSIIASGAGVYWWMVLARLMGLFSR